MNPTPGPWAYNPDFDEVQAVLDHTIAKAKSGLGIDVLVRHANGYLMAAAPVLCDELTNLSQAVRAYTESGVEPSTYGEVHLLRQIEVMLKRAEDALGHIFPPEGTS